jgi:beta-ureidopropionase / N-carbamoyl-L-amino-acid hydrolase
MPQIDGARLLADLHRLRDFGRFETGVHRPTYSDVDVQSRHWLTERMAEAGLAPEIDGIGNVIGRAPGPGPILLVGSHTETQNYAGWLDGALGVMYALELARVLPGRIDVAAWADEEGHYGAFLGSRSFVREVEEVEIDAGRNAHNGTPMREALASAGLAGRRRSHVEAGRYRGYLEAHIEQGDELESTGKKLGIVTSIVGIWTFSVVFHGVQNHAGTTRMAIRKDAGVALVNYCAAVQRRFPKVASARSVWTVGRVALMPGAASIIPGRAEMLLQMRDAEPETLAAMEAMAHQLVAEANAAGPCKVEIECVFRSTPRVMSPAFQDALDRAAERRAPGLHLRMPSGAGHDAQILAQAMPAAMLFVPSIGGISHHIAEDTAEPDIILGCQVLADAAEDILADAAP